jgi:hypothetical protein
MLPAHFPAEPAEVVFFVYQREPLPTGRISYRVTGPSGRIFVHTKSGATREEKFEANPADPQGNATWVEEESRTVGKAEAEQALLEIVQAGSELSRHRQRLSKAYCALSRDPQKFGGHAADYAPFWSALECPIPSLTEVPAHNRKDLKEAAPRPPDGDAQTKAKRLFDAIRLDEPALAAEFFFPRDAFLMVKGIEDPGKYWDRLRQRFDVDVHALHRKLRDLEQARFDRLEIVTRGGWVKVGEEGNALPYWASRHSWLHYRVGEEQRKFEVRVLITWDDRWYVIHLSEFH